MIKLLFEYANEITVIKFKMLFSMQFRNLSMPKCLALYHQILIPLLTFPPFLFKNVNMTSGYLYVKKMATAKQMTYQGCLCGFLKLVRSLIFKYQSWSWLLKLIAETGLGS